MIKPKDKVSQLLERRNNSGRNIVTQFSSANNILVRKSAALVERYLIVKVARDRTPESPLLSSWYDNRRRCRESSLQTGVYSKMPRDANTKVSDGYATGDLRRA